MCSRHEDQVVSFYVGVCSVAKHSEYYDMRKHVRESKESREVDLKIDIPN